MDATKITSVFLFIFTLILSLVQKGACIKCYKCNSKIHGDECSDLPNISAERKALYVKNCDHEYDQTKTYSLCRKIVQNVKDEVRVIRQCATAGSGKCVSKSGYTDIKMTYCECDSKLCNHGNSIQIPHMSTLFIVSLSTILFVIIH